MSSHDRLATWWAKLGWAAAQVPSSMYIIDQSSPMHAHTPNGACICWTMDMMMAGWLDG